MLYRFRHTIRQITIFGCILVVSGVIVWLSIEPTNNKNWALDQQILADVEFRGHVVSIKNIRNFDYKSETDYVVRYYDADFDINTIKSIDYIVEPFDGYWGAAHSFLSFGFEDGRHLAISVEIRKKKGESFSPIKGLFRQYELMYVIADEQDVIKLRSNHRKDDVYLYPIKTTKERMQNIFLDMTYRAHTLAHKPEFYNTIYNNCVINIVRHVNKIIPGRIPFHFAMIFPSFSDRVAYKLGLIDSDLSFEDMKKSFLINSRAMMFADDPHFSRRIRDYDMR